MGSSTQTLARTHAHTRNHAHTQTHTLSLIRTRPQVEAFCATLADSLADKRKDSAHEGDGNDYIVKVDGIILGFGAKMLLEQTDLRMKRNHKCV